MVSVVTAAEVSENGTVVHVSPDASNGHKIFSEFRFSDLLLDGLDLLYYLDYLAAVIVVLYCTLIVIIGIGKKKQDLKSIKDELFAKDSVVHTAKAICFMWIGLEVIDFFFNYII
ncbi:MAG: hypothetical protein ABFD07_03320 [Methanobacterium sp.]